MPYTPKLPGIEVGPCPVGRREAALEQLFAETPPETRRQRITGLLETLAAPDGRAPGQLIAATRDQAVVGAALALAQPGRSAVVHAPRLACGEREPLADAILIEVNAWLDLQGVQVAQSLLDPMELLDADRLARNGFRPACTLCYLVCGAESFPAAAPKSNVEFLPWRPTDDRRYAPILEATYDETKDCPSLNGVRITPDVLAGYRATAAGADGPWFVVACGKEVAGCLFLADHSQTDQYELMYMGIVRQFRGRGLGRAMVEQAQWRTRCAERAQLVLAVDAQNDPARQIYASCGFRVFTQRLVYLRTALG